MLISLFLILPLFGLVVFNLPLGRSLWKGIAVWPALLSVLQIAATLFPDSPWWTFGGGELFSFPFLALDDLGRLMLLLIGVMVPAVSLVGSAVIRDDRGRHNFAALLLVSMLGMNGVVLARDIFTLYVFLDIVSVSSFILIAFRREQDAYEGAFKYIVLSAVATMLLLSSIGIFFMVGGGTGFAQLADAVSAHPDNPLILCAILLFFAGLFIKGGVVPFHGWLPDAYTAAPAPVSILLAGIVTKVSGVYILLRLVVEVFGTNPKTGQILLFAGALTIVVGALAAMGQSDFKRMLAYSSISQMGYIVLGLGTGSELGVAGAVFHFFNHAVFKAQLFINAAAVEMQTGSRDMDRMGGLAAKMPVTGTTSVIAFLSAAGIPPLAGFWSKLVIVVALWRTGHGGYMAVAILASLLTLSYFLTLQRKVFFGRTAPAFAEIREAGWPVTLPSVLFALIIVGVGLSLPFLFDTIILPIRGFL